MKTKIGFCMFLLAAGLCGLAQAYSWTSQEWCVDDCVPSFKIDVNSFTSRGITSNVVDQLIDAAPVWNTMGEDLCIGNNNNSGTCYGENTMCARYEYQDDDLVGALAYCKLFWDIDFDCGFFELGNDHYYHVYNASYPFGFKAQNAKTANGFISVSMHEFGHSMSLGDYPGATGPNALMSYTSFKIPHSDDATGLINRYGYRNQGIKTRLASSINYTDGSLGTWSAIQQWGGSDYLTSLRPAIVGNWHQGIGGTYEWDYAAAWTVGTNIKIALLKDLADNTVQVKAIATIPVGNTLYAPSIAVGSANQLLVVWKNVGNSGNNYANYLTVARVQVNSGGTGFTSITTSTLSPYQPLSEPVVTFMPGRYRYVISWVMDGSSVTNSRHRIAAMVSSNSEGSAWNAPYTYEGSDPNFPEFVTSPWQAPAITCYNNLLTSATCLMMYKQFRTSDTRFIDQQAFAMDANNTKLMTNSTDWSTWNYSHVAPQIASSLSDWLYTHVFYSGGKGTMMYRISTRPTHHVL